MQGVPTSIPSTHFAIFSLVRDDTGVDDAGTGWLPGSGYVAAHLHVSTRVSTQPWPDVKPHRHQLLIRYQHYGLM